MRLVNPALERLLAGELCLGIGVRGMRGVEVGRIMKTAGYDWLFIDMEHGPTSVETAYALSVAALDAGIAPIVRVPSGELALAARCLDGGALGIVLPHLETAEQAREIVHALRFPPLGRRSIGGSFPQLGFRSAPAREAVPALEQATLVIATLETPLGIENAAAIASVPGIDALLIGGNDLCLEMGIPSQFDDERVAAAVQRVVDACKAHGKHPGLGGIYQPDLIKRYIGLGMRLMLCGSDIGLLMNAARERADFARSCN